MKAWPSLSYTRASAIEYAQGSKRLFLFGGIIAFSLYLTLINAAAAFCMIARYGRLGF
jgi:hypothetical protein